MSYGDTVAADAPARSVELVRSFMVVSDLVDMGSESCLVFQEDADELRVELRPGAAASQRPPKRLQREVTHAIYLAHHSGDGGQAANICVGHGEDGVHTVDVQIAIPDIEG